MPIKPDTEPMPVEAWDEPEPGLPLPLRPRRRLWTPLTGLVLALLLGAGGFLAGVELEKNQVSTSGGASVPAAAAVAAGRAGTRAGVGAGSLRAPGGAAGAAGAAAFGGAGGRAGFAGGFGGGNSSFGTVSSARGHTLYVTVMGGNTVKVTLSSSTALSKTETVSESAIRPGDTVIVQGLTSRSGTITAATVNDSGNRSTGSSSGGGGTGSRRGGGSAAAALNSLFGSGG